MSTRQGCRCFVFFDCMPLVGAYAFLCVRVWPKHIIMHHLLGQEVAMCGLSLITGPFGWWEWMGNGNVLTVSHSMINAWGIAQYVNDFTEQPPFTPLHEDNILSWISFPLQGQNHIYPLSILSGKSVLHACSVLPQCIPNPIFNFSSKALPSINHTHTSVPTIFERCHKKLLPVSVGWNLFVPYKTKIYTNSQSVSTNSSSPSTYFMHHHHLCQSEMKRLDLPVICCVQSKSVSSMLASVSVCGHVYVCVCVGGWVEGGVVCKLSCVSVLQQCQSVACMESCISAASHRIKAATAGSFMSSITSKTE